MYYINTITILCSHFVVYNQKNDEILLIYYIVVLILQSLLTICLIDFDILPIYLSCLPIDCILLAVDQNILMLFYKIIAIVLSITFYCYK